MVHTKASIPLMSSANLCQSCKFSLFQDTFIRLNSPCGVYSCILPVSPRHRPSFPGSDFGGLRNHPFGTGSKSWLVQTAVRLPSIPVISPVLKWGVGLVGLAVLLFRVFPTQIAEPVLKGIVNAAENALDSVKRR